MPKYPTAYQQGLHDAVVFSLQGNPMDEENEYLSHDILERANQLYEASDEALRDAGNPDEVLVAATLNQQAMTCALIRIAERLEDMATMLKWEMKRRATTPEGFEG